MIVYRPAGKKNFFLPAATSSGQKKTLFVIVSVKSLLWHKTYFEKHVTWFLKIGFMPYFFSLNSSLSPNHDKND